MTSHQEEYGDHQVGNEWQNAKAIKAQHLKKIGATCQTHWGKVKPFWKIGKMT